MNKTTRRGFVKSAAAVAGGLCTAVVSGGAAVLSASTKKKRHLFATKGDRRWYQQKQNRSRMVFTRLRFTHQYSLCSVAFR